MRAFIPFMTARRLIAIGIIFFFTSVAWMILSQLVNQRTHQYDSDLYSKVEGLWGEVQNQQAPSFNATAVKVIKGRNGKTLSGTADLTALKVASDIQVNLTYDPRKKGLLWYNLYKIDFKGTYTLENPTDDAGNVIMKYQFPSSGAIYDDFTVMNDGKPLQLTATEAGRQSNSFQIAPRGKTNVVIQYRSQGMDAWHYLFNNGYSDNGNISTIDNFHLTATTNFKDVDFVENTLSPSEKTEEGAGWKLSWQYNHLISGQNVGIAVPQRLNPGPFVQKVTFFAPVSLFFFFFVMLIIGAIKKISFHPMHFFFIATSFFAFHLLFAYLVDHVDIQPAFLIAALTSIALNISYLRLVVGMKFAFVEAGISQFIYLIVFTYSFFFEGYTGLIIVVLSIVTLFVTMQLTGRLNWDEIFPEVEPRK